MPTPIWTPPPGVARLKAIVAGPVGAGQNPSSYLDGWGFDNSYPPNAGPQPGVKIAYIGQVSNRAAAASPNMGFGAVTVPSLANGVVGSLVIADSLIATTSYVLVQPVYGTTVPAAGAQGALLANARVPTAGAVPVDVRNAGTAAWLGSDYQLWYWVFGTING